MTRGVRVAVVEPVGLAPQSDASIPAPLMAENVAEAILDMLTQPRHISIVEVLIRPTDQPA